MSKGEIAQRQRDVHYAFRRSNLVVLSGTSWTEIVPPIPEGRHGLLHYLFYTNESGSASAATVTARLVAPRFGAGFTMGLGRRTCNSGLGSPIHNNRPFTAPFGLENEGHREVLEVGDSVEVQLSIVDASHYVLACWIEYT